MDNKGVLYYREVEKFLYIRAVGHIRAAICTELRKKVFKRMEEEPTPRGISVDLSQCEYMDSTFMGLLVGFNKLLMEKKGRSIEILNPQPECLELLKGLGVLPLFRVTNEKCILPDDMELVSQAEKAPAEMLLKAHEDLIDISEDNKSKFSALRSILRKNIEDSEDDGN